MQVLPLARKHFSVEEQRTLLYQSLRVMPLKLLERVLPWLVGVLSEDEAKDMFQNMRLAGQYRFLIGVYFRSALQIGDRSGCIFESYKQSACS